MNGALLVGLGNPGSRYRASRHNLGADVIEQFAARHAISLISEHALFSFGAGRIDDHPVGVAIPRTFMNDSGRAVAALLATHPFLPESMLVVFDDMDLPLGRLRFRRRGGDGGHLGVRSIIDALRTDRFWRLRLGIGRPGPSGDAVEHVLAVAPKEPALDSMKQQALEALQCLVVEGPDAAMNRYNQRPAE
ncbi:MAG: aminoacyl-tRNA hydrolase [Nitrospirota bacterium]